MRYDKLLSSYASNFNLRPYIVVWIMKLGLDVRGAHITRAGEVVALPTAGELLTEMSKGLLLCDLVSLLEAGSHNHSQISLTVPFSE